MARIPKSDLGKTPFKKIIGHNYKIYEKWVELEEEFYNHPTLGRELLEQVRRVSAWRQDCKYWMSFGDKPSENHQDKRIAAAMALASQSIENPHEISNDTFETLKTLFTTEEISTLCAYIAFISGANKFGIMVGLTPDDLKDYFFI